MKAESDTMQFAESLSPTESKEEGKAPSAKEKLSPWQVVMADDPQGLQDALLDLDAKGYFIYKVIHRQHVEIRDTGNVDYSDFIIIAKPKNFVNQASGIRKHLESISKSFAEMLKLDKEAIATARKE